MQYTKYKRNNKRKPKTKKYKHKTIEKIKKGDKTQKQT